MLSAPPCALAASTSRCAASSGSSTVRRMSDISSIPTSLLSPSEHRRTRSPVCSSSSHMSVSTSEDTPRARGQDVTLGVDGRLGLGHLAVAHPLLGQAVVLGHLDQAPAGEHVGPRVPDVGEGERVPAVGAADQRHGRQRGAHAAQVGVGLALLPHRGVGLRERLAQAGDRRRPLEGLVERLDGDPRRDLTADVTTHAVGHRVQIGPLEGEILVDGAHPPDVGRRTRAQHRHRATSNTVEPIWRRSPLPRRTAWVICSRLTKVPLVEPRSSTQSWSPRRKSRACSVEV